jgi:hypothetical protein
MEKHGQRWKASTVPTHEANKKWVYGPLAITCLPTCPTIKEIGDMLV